MTQTPTYVLVPTEHASQIAIHAVAPGEPGTPVIDDRIGTLINLVDLGPDDEEIPSPEWRLDALDGEEICDISDWTQLRAAVYLLEEHLRAAPPVAATATS